MMKMSVAGQTITSGKSKSSVSRTVSFNVADSDADDEDDADEVTPLMGAGRPAAKNSVRSHLAPWLSSYLLNTAGMAKSLTRRVISLLVSPSDSCSPLKPFITTDFAMLTYLFTGDSWSAVTTERGLNILIDEETEKFHEDCETLRKETVEVFVKLRENPALAAVIVPDLTLEWTGQRLRALGENLLIEGAAIDFGCNAPIYISRLLKYPSSNARSFL